MALESSKVSVLLGTLDLKPDVGQKTVIITGSAQEVEHVFQVARPRLEGSPKTQTHFESGVISSHSSHFILLCECQRPRRLLLCSSRPSEASRRSA